MSKRLWSEKMAVQKIIYFMNTVGRKADWEEDSGLVSSCIALSTTGNSAEHSWDAMEVAGLWSPRHSEGQEGKGLL